MKFNVITLFENMIEDGLKWGVVGQALQSGLVQVQTVNPRSFTHDIHKTVDDRPFGGGDGMVLKIDPLLAALNSIPNKGRVVYLSAQGAKWSDAMARGWLAESADESITLICGRYGGIDQRLLSEVVDEEISIGDYIISGGELAALVVIDSMARLRSDTLGNELSSQMDSFAQGLLEGPTFTRPRNHDLGDVPEIFLSGDHKKIALAQKMLSILTTMKRRPDLIQEFHRLDWQKYRAVLAGFAAKDWRACGFQPEEIEECFGRKNQNP